MVATLPASSTLCPTFAVELKNKIVLPEGAAPGTVPFCPVIVNGPVLVVVKAFFHVLELSQNHVSKFVVSV